MVKDAHPPRAELRAALVSAAMSMIAERGYPALRARDLAAKVGCAVGSIYNVFPDIDALILSVKARALDALEDDVLRELGPFASADADAAAARFQALGHVYLDFAARNWRLWSAVFEHRANESEALRTYMTRLDAILTNIEQPLGVLLPEMEAGPRRQLARTMFAAVHGVVSLGLDGKLGPVRTDQLHDQVQLLLGSMLRGLRSGAL